MRILKAIQYVLEHWEPIEALVKKEELEAEEKRKFEERHRLKLCYSHRQEQNQSYYSTHNCDYCNSIKGKLREIDIVKNEENDGNEH